MAVDIGFDRSDLKAVGRSAARLVERFIRKRMDSGDFGPGGTAGAPYYSTEEMWFNVHEPSGRAGAFRAIAGASGDADYVRLEGGYNQFRRIYRGGSSSRNVTIDLTGSVRQALQVEADFAGNSMGIEVNFKGKHTDKYRMTTVEQRAHYVNRQYEFMWLSPKEQKRVVKRIAKEILDRVDI
ncbi:hypothetical protein [Salinibacter phage M31CR41-2]|uniref:Uncharacterized protein n=2 Tax=Kairosalinivirus TaxID=2560158 RepID=A0A2I6UH20_9CAUD|nr:hypothetical protein FGG68_gp68 [Salinibacter phage M31CR41-2]YP_009639630.1 hypothetical protein FGG69_gp18 [Salinibacter phage SRUTV-1]ATU47013.1 hypothetical protein [Salinibacter phage SRUTV-1]AUO79284.1 hypothetical protein [Salinibacter phage M31CR41-2]AUO79354.1 hypothetical protein [Salinibacter virus M31CR41-3]